MTTTALLIIDCQNDFFPGGKCELEGQLEVAGNIQMLLDTARDQDQTIVYVQHQFKEEDAPFAVEGTPGAEIHDMVKPLPHEPVVTKFTSNIFLNNNLKQILDDENVEQLVICGSMSKDCIAAAAHATTELGYPITIIYDACATREPGSSDTSSPREFVQAAIMASLSFVCSNIVSTKEYLERASVA